MNVSLRSLLCLALLVPLACGETTPAPSTPPGPASAPPLIAPPPASSAAPPVVSAPPVTPAPALRTPAPGVPLRPDTSPTPPGLATAPASQPSDLDRMMGRMRGRLRSCFQRQLGVDPAFDAPSMRWELTVDRDGHVTRARYLCQPPLPPDFRACMEDALRSQDLDPGPRTLTTGQCASENKAVFTIRNEPGA